MDAKMETTKRIRSINWSDQEKKVLRMLVLERAEIIEKKDTSTNTNAAKKKAWEEVLTSFNAVNSSNKRDMTQLLNQWRNMKNKAKKSEFAFRRARTMTGGGPPPPSPPPEDRELIDAIPDEFTIDSNYHDSDTINQKEPTRTMGTQSPVSLSQKKLEPEVSHTSNENPAPVFQTTQQRLGPSGSRPVNKKQKPKKSSDCCSMSHEHEIFILAKTAREKAMLRDQEAHDYKMMNEREMQERKMALMALEEEYIKTKIRNLVAFPKSCE